MPAGGGPPARRPRREPSARRVGSKPGQALPPPSGTTASRALHGHHKHAHASSPPSDTAASRMPKGRHTTHPGPAAALGHYSLPHAEGAPHHPPRPRRRPRTPQPPAHCTAATNTPRPCRRPRALQPPACRRGATPPTQASSPPSGTAGTESGSHSKHPRARGPGVLICDRGAKTTCPRRSPYG